jgi:tetratricopeptide (TPR) repeat protein
VSRSRFVLVLIGVLCCVPERATSQDEADAAWRRGDIEVARRLYAEKLVADSTDERALHRMALIFGWDGEYAASISLFDQLLAISPRNWEAAIDRARIYAWRGDTERALQLLDEVLQLHPGNVAALQARAKFQGWAGEYSAALSTYEQIGQVLPEDRSVPRERALVLSWASRLDAALAIYDSLLQVDPQDREALLGLARVLAWNDQLDSAAAIYRQMLASDPNDVAALQGIALSMSWSGDLSGGERFWRQVLEQDDANVEGLVGLATNLRWQAREAEAFGVLRRAEQLAPANRDVKAEMQWVRAAVAPRAGASVVYENDSDGNRITTLTARGAWRRDPRFELGVMGYTRQLGISGSGISNSHAYGAQLEGRIQLRPGWDFSVGLGASGTNVEGSKAQSRLSAKATSPVRNLIVGALSYLHEPLDASQLLVQNNVVMDMVSLDLRATPRGGWRILVSGSYTRLEGSEPNTRWAVYAHGSRRVARQFTVGASFRSFGFDKNLNDGYFDPDLYVLGEINFRWQARFGRWYPTVEAAPGIQQVGKGGAASGAGRIRIAIGFRVLPGREFELSGGYSTTGLSVFGSGADDYRYRSVMFLTKWVI